MALDFDIQDISDGLHFSKTY